MATLLYDLKGYAVTDTGEVIVKYKYLVLDQILSGRSTKGLKTFRQSFAEQVATKHFRDLTDLSLSDVTLHNQRCAEDRRIPIIDINGVPENPSATTFDFNLPDQYRDIDLVEYLVPKLASHFDQIPEAYVDRLMIELDMIVERQMEDFVRSLIYMVETFEQNHIVYGVGRGSACASLVLYLVGVHMVDPIEYNIPIEEFLR